MLFRSRTIPLQTGELSALLKLTPHLVELDIDLPPPGDLLRLIYGEGEVILVPMLRALYMRLPVITASSQIEHLDTLVHVRCELGNSNDSDATIPTLGPGTRSWTALQTLQFIFDSAESRDTSQKLLNNSSSLTPVEAETVFEFRVCCDPDYIRDESFVKNILFWMERYEVTNKVLHVGVFFSMLVCGIFTLILLYIYSSGDKFTH